MLYLTPQMFEFGTPERLQRWSEQQRTKPAPPTEQKTKPVPTAKCDLAGAARYLGMSPRKKAQEATEQEKPHGSLLSTERAAQYLDISPETLRRLCKRKVITFIRITPHEYRFDLADLEEYKNSRRNRRKSAVK